jgi:hypothetical protein
MADLNLVRELAEGDDHLAVLAANRVDGTIHASLVKAGVLDHPDTGQAVIGVVVAGSARKLDHLRHSGHATVVFKHGYRWVSAEGPVQLIRPADSATGDLDTPLPALLRLIYQAAGGSHDDWEEFDRAMRDDRRSAVLVRASKLTSNT